MVGHRRSLRLFWMVAACLATIVAALAVPWGVARHAEDKAWSSVRSYGEGLGKRTGTEIYESISPCDSSDETGSVQGVIHATSEADVVRQLARLRGTLARDGWVLARLTGPDARRGDFQGKRWIAGREVWVFTGPSSDPNHRYYWVEMSVEHCFLGMV